MARAPRTPRASARAEKPAGAIENTGPVPAADAEVAVPDDVTGIAAMVARAGDAAEAAIAAEAEKPAGAIENTGPVLAADAEGELGELDNNVVADSVAPADEPVDAGGTAETSKAEGEVPAASPEAAPTARDLIAEARAARDTTTTPDAPELFVYPVRSPLRHDGKRYSPDDPRANTVRLAEAEAETLVALGVLGEPGASEHD